MFLRISPFTNCYGETHTHTQQKANKTKNKKVMIYDS